jgi:UPF0716 protein FxsA
MIGFIFLLLLVLPIIELAVIIEVGSRIGVFPTLGLLILMSIVGAWLLKREGTAAWRRFQEAMGRGEIPTKEATDGAMILFGGALLITPGFLSDVVGMLMILPPSRAVLKSGTRKLLGFFALKRFGIAGQVGRRVYDARVTKVSRSPATRPVQPERPSPGRLPSSEGRDASGSPDTE